MSLTKLELVNIIQTLATKMDQEDLDHIQSVIKIRRAEFDLNRRESFNYKVGQQVRVHFRKGDLVGEISKLNKNSAIVTAKDGESLRVPQERLQLAS